MKGVSMQKPAEVMDLDLFTFCNIMDFREQFEQSPLQQRKEMVYQLIFKCEIHRKVTFSPSITKYNIVRAVSIATGLSRRHIYRFL